MAEVQLQPPSDPASTLTKGLQSYKPLGECMQALFESNLWTDVTFRCKDQNEEDIDDRIHAHRNILAARSPVFKAMFFGPYDGSKEIVLEDIDSEDLRIFLRSLYSDDPSRNVDDLMTTITIGHKYQVLNLVDKCFNYLSTSISLDNVCTLLNLAMLYNSEILSEACSKYMDDNATEVLENPGFLELSKESLTYALKGDTFYADEAKIFRRSEEWAKNRCSSTDGDSLRKALGNCFYYIRTPTMTLKDFIDCTKRKGYYNIEETEDIIEKIAKHEDVMCDDETKCISSNRRLQRIIDIDPYGNLDSFYTCNSKKIEAKTRLMLRPSIDVFIRKIKLSKLNIVGIAKHYNYTNEVENVTNIQLKCVVSLDGKDIANTLDVITESTPYLILNVNLLLKASDEWYNLGVSVKSTSEKLKLSLKLKESKPFERCLTGVPISIKDEGSNDMVIETITFENTHHRDT